MSSSDSSSRRKLCNVKIAVMSFVACLTSSLAHSRGRLNSRKRFLHIPNACSMQYRIELSFWFNCFVRGFCRHSVVLNVGTVCFVLGWAESIRINGGICSYCISLLVGFLVTTGIDGMLAKYLVSSSFFNIELFQTRPSATDPGQPTVNSTNH